MSRSRMFDDDEPGGEQPASPRTTIVGGRPPEDSAETPPVPTGIQRLLRLAAVDLDFRAELLERRAEVADAAEVELSPSEQKILAAIPASQIEAMAEQMPPPAGPRRDFLRKTAASAVILLGGAVLSDCDSCDRADQRGIATGGGAAPDEPPKRPDHRETDTEGGIAPHRPDHRVMDEVGGAAPDEPPPRRNEDRPSTTKGGAAPDEPPPRRNEDRPTVNRGGADPEEPPERPDRVPSPPGGARPDLPPEPAPDGGSSGGGGFAEPPPGWDGGAPDGGVDEPVPTRPDRPYKTRGIKFREPPPKRPHRGSPTKGIRPEPDED